MSSFTVIENDNGLLVVAVESGETADEAAVRYNGVVVDEGPYKTYDDAYDAMLQIPARLDDIHMHRR